MRTLFFFLGAVLTNATCLEMEAADERPAGWQIRTRNGVARLDYSVHHSGNASLWISGTNSVEVQQTLKADPYRGKRLRISTFVKARSVEGEAYLWASTSPRGAWQPFQVQTTNVELDWRKTEVTLVVPPGDVGLTFGVGLYGAGELWVDDFQLEVLEGARSSDTTQSSLQSEPSEAQTKAAEAEVRGRPMAPANLDFEGPRIPIRSFPLELSWQPLWPEGAPKSRGLLKRDTPALAVYLASEPNNTGAAVIVCPGGAYSVLSMDHEGVQVCQWLNSRGISAFLLRYRLRSDGYQPDVALLDGRRAVRFVRSQSEKFKVDARRIGMLGFSAGGHLAWSVAATADAGDSRATDPIERASSRPDFLILGYPAVVTWERQGLDVGSKVISRQFPPTFIFHTDADTGVFPEDILPLYEKLRWAGIRVEMHIFGGYGPHGMGLASGHPSIGRWPELAHAWLQKNALLTAKPRVSVTGTVKIDGVFMYAGYVTFVPADRNDPEAVAFILGRKNEGGFAIPGEEGPAAARYEVVVHEIAREGDRGEQEPRMPGSRTYFSPAPDQPPFTFTLKPGENEIDIEITTASVK